MEMFKPGGPIRTLADIEALEKVPLEKRFESWDLNDYIRLGLNHDPGKVALSYFSKGDPAETPVETTYREFQAQINQTANLFHELGVRRDDAVLFLLPSIPEALVVVFASIARGVTCPVNWMLKGDHVAELIANSKAKVVIGLAPTPGYQIWENLQEIRRHIAPGVKVLSVPLPGGQPLPDSDLATMRAKQPSDRLVFDNPRGPDDLAAYIHSGGTTGAPKLVKLVNRGLVHKLWVKVQTMAYGPDDVLFGDMPLFHMAGFMYASIIPVALGSALVLPSPMGARDKVFVANYWKFIERMRVNCLHAVPATLSVLAANPPTSEDISSLQPFSPTGSTVLPVNVAEAIEAKIGIRLVATYGATENTLNVSQAPRDGDPKYGSAGIRNPDTEFKIAHLDLNNRIVKECGVNEIGVVLVRSPGTTPGYADESQNKGVLMGDGWVNNGDLGRLDEDGYLWITGRAKDLIIRSGHNIDPRIIEDVLYKHPSVFMAAAVSKPDSYAGELPVAYIQLKPGAKATEDEIMALLRKEVSDPAAVPKDVFFVNELPLTDVRKIAKNVLREDAAKRVYEGLLQAAVPQGQKISVDVHPDDRHGTAATVSLGGAIDRAAAEAAVLATMKPYTAVDRIVWLE